MPGHHQPGKHSRRKRWTNQKQIERRWSQAGPASSHQDQPISFSNAAPLQSAVDHRKLWAAGQAHQCILQSLHLLLGSQLTPVDALQLKSMLQRANSSLCTRLAEVMTSVVEQHQATVQSLQSALQQATHDQQRLWLELEASVATTQHLQALVNDMSSTLASLQETAASASAENEQLRSENEFLQHEIEELLDASQMAISTNPRSRKMSFDVSGSVSLAYKTSSPKPSKPVCAHPLRLTQGPLDWKVPWPLIRLLQAVVMVLDERDLHALAGYAIRYSPRVFPFHSKTLQRRRKLAEHLLTIVAGDSEGALLTMIQMVTANEERIVRLLHEGTVVQFIEEDILQWRKDQTVDESNTERVEGGRASIVGQSRESTLKVLKIAPAEDLIVWPPYYFSVFRHVSSLPLCWRMRDAHFPSKKPLVLWSIRCVPSENECIPFCPFIPAPPSPRISPRLEQARQQLVFTFSDQQHA